MQKIKETLTIVALSDLTRLYIPDEEGHSYQICKVEILATESEPEEAEGEALNYNIIYWYVTQENWQEAKEYIDHGIAERIMPNGDKIFYKFDGQSGEEEITGGTGKFKNIKGKGLYKGEVEGGIWQAWHHWEYEIGR